MSTKKQLILTLLSSTFLSQADIARKVGCKEPYITQIKNEMADELRKMRGHKYDLFKERCLDMLAKKIEEFNTVQSKPSYFKAQLMGMERLAKMLGWDAPDKVQVEAVVTEVVFNVNSPKVIDVEKKDE